MQDRLRHIERYGTLFFVLCVIVAAWQCVVMVVDLRVMGRTMDEGLMAPLSINSVVLLFSPLNALFLSLSHKLPEGLLFFDVIFISLANALLLLAPYWLLRRRWRWLVWIPVTLLTVWCLMQLCYCRAYDDLMPWQSLTMTDNVNKTLFQSTVALMRWHDLLIVVPYLLLIAVCLIGRKTKDSDGHRLKPFLTTMAAFLLTALMGYSDSFLHFDNKFVHNFSNRGYFSSNGLFPYGIFTLNQILFNNSTVGDEEREMIRQFLADECPQYSDNPFSSGERRNLVLIIVESLHTWPIGMVVDGREVTPVMNRLVSGEHVIYAPHVLFQTSHGHSSDAHFIYNTGLLPLRDAVVAVNHGDGPYPSLAAALKGYDCRELICTPGMNWNQSVTSRSYGFDSLYTREHMLADGAFKRHNNVDDAALTDFAARLLPQLRQPFFLEMVTMTMHTPYPPDKLRPSWITASDTLNAEARSYLNCVNLTDSCIGAFIDDLHKQELADNTVVAIVSDHTQLYLNRIEGRSASDFTPHDWGIPMIVWGTDTTLRYEPVIGQVDVFPTLLDIMGANEYPWKGLGHSILRYPVQSAIQHLNMTVIGDSTYLTPQQFKAWEIGRFLIFDRANQFNTLLPDKKDNNK